MFKSLMNTFSPNQNSLVFRLSIRNNNSNLISVVLYNKKPALINPNENRSKGFRGNIDNHLIVGHFGFSRFIKFSVRKREFLP